VGGTPIGAPIQSKPFENNKNDQHFQTATFWYHTSRILSKSKLCPFLTLGVEFFISKNMDEEVAGCDTNGEMTFEGVALALLSTEKVNLNPPSSQGGSENF